MNGEQHDTEQEIQRKEVLVKVVGTVEWLHF